MILFPGWVQGDGHCEARGVSLPSSGQNHCQPWWNSLCHHHLHHHQHQHHDHDDDQRLGLSSSTTRGPRGEEKAQLTQSWLDLQVCHRHNQHHHQNSQHHHQQNCPHHCQNHCHRNHYHPAGQQRVMLIVRPINMSSIALSPINPAKNITKLSSQKC